MSRAHAVTNGQPVLPPAFQFPNSPFPPISLSLSLPSSLSMAFSSSSHSLLSPHLPRPKLPKSVSIRSSSSSSSSSAFDLRSYWATLITEINAHLDAAIPVRNPEKIYSSMRHSVLAPGAKRAPPVMCVAACELLGGPRPAAFPTAAALEMVHAASLVHDDLPSFDAAPSRRGLPSNHSVFGVDIAVLAGDALLPLGLSHLIAATPTRLLPAGDPSAVLLRVVREICRAVGATGMAAGQFLDLNGMDSENVMEILERKFGEMAECSAVCGGLLGGAQEAELEALRRYGRAVGLLYQVADDVLMESAAGQNGNSMRSNASVVRAMGMDRAVKIVEELRVKAKKELEEFGDKYGEKVLPLYSFVDYAVERSFVVEAEAVSAA